MSCPEATGVPTSWPGILHGIAAASAPAEPAVITKLARRSRTRGARSRSFTRGSSRFGGVVRSAAMNPRYPACLLACILAFSAAGCTSLKTIRLTDSPPSAPFERVRVGDTVRVETRDGERHQFQVRQIDGDVLVSESGDRYPRGQVVRLQRRSVSIGRTALLVGGVLLALLVGESGSPL